MMGCEERLSRNKKNLPHYTEGPIVRGFGRGSSELGKSIFISLGRGAFQD